jgi:predicted CXXCH cytochrome family protein
MRQKIALPGFFVFVVLLAVVVFSVEYRPHAFTQCSSCHVSENPSGTAAREMIEPVTVLCRQCHEKTLSEGYMHPVDVRPGRVRVPADMPLSPSGELTCSTCHDVHSDYFTPYGAPSHFLRREESGRDFCTICHGTLETLSRGHRASLGEAHFTSRYIVTDVLQELDPMSMNCVTCHDGAFATSVTIQAGRWRHEKSFMRYDQGDHPVGIRYDEVRIKRGRKTDLRPLFEVDRRIRFFNGRVGCGSCHDPYSKIRKRLVMSDENSKLCLACHIV